MKQKISDKDIEKILGFSMGSTYLSIGYALISIVTIIHVVFIDGSNSMMLGTWMFMTSFIIAYHLYRVSQIAFVFSFIAAIAKSNPDFLEKSE